MGILNMTHTKANDKIIICNFRRLNPADFPLWHNLKKGEISKETILISYNGKIYLNSKIKGIDFLAEIFETIMSETRYTLDQYCKKFKMKYSSVTFDNIAEMEGSNEEKVYAFTLLCIPVELKRRQIEHSYYSKIRPI